MHQTLPVISLESYLKSNDDKELAILGQQVFEAFHEHGAFLVTSHGVDIDLCKKAQNDFRYFYELPLHKKEVFQAPNKYAYRGYHPIGSTNANALMGRRGSLDVLEKWRFGPEEPNELAENEPPNFVLGWSPNVYAKCFEDSCKKFYKEMDKLARHLMDIFSVALGQPKNFMQDLCKGGNHILGAAFYPMIPTQNKFRMAPHTDITPFTIIMQDETENGLKLQKPTGQWVFVNTPTPDQMLVIPGDNMNHLTNDYWQATLHAVCFPPILLPRISLQYFLYFPHNATVECLPNFFDKHGKSAYGTVKYSDWAQKRLEKYLSLTSGGAETD